MAVTDDTSEDYDKYRADHCSVINSPSHIEGQRLAIIEVVDHSMWVGQCRTAALKDCLP